MVIDSNLKQSSYQQNISYSTNKKYIGHNVTDDNSLKNSIDLDIKEGGANVIIKYRSFANNHPNATLETSLIIFKPVFVQPYQTIVKRCRNGKEIFKSLNHTFYDETGK